jgi:hypothetical protein
MGTFMRACFRSLFLSTVLAAGQASAGGIQTSKYGMDYYRAGAGARAEGMGNAAAAAAEDVTAVYWNPAGLAELTRPELQVMHSERFAGAVNVDFLGAAVPRGRAAAFGVALYRLGVDGIPITRLTFPDQPLGAWVTGPDGRTRLNVPIVEKTVDDQELALVFAAASRRSDRLSVGLNLKTVYKSVGGQTAWGLGFDLGALLRPWKSLRVGAVIKDATTTLLAWREGRTEAVPPRFRAGLAYPVSVRLFRIVPALDLETGFSRLGRASQWSSAWMDAEAHAGLEIAYRDRVSLRAGANAGRFTAGAGFRISSLHVDYSFSSHQDLGPGHRLSANFSLKTGADSPL